MQPPTLANDKHPADRRAYPLTSKTLHEAFARRHGTIDQKGDEFALRLRSRLYVTVRPHSTRQYAGPEMSFYISRQTISVVPRPRLHAVTATEMILPDCRTFTEVGTPRTSASTVALQHRMATLAAF
jgi:hypothetical protein